MTEREAFEQQAELHGLEIAQISKTVGYQSQATRAAWLLWQASRKQALEEAIRAVQTDGQRMERVRDEGGNQDGHEFLEIAEQCAFAIRSLSTPDTEGGKGC